MSRRLAPAGTSGGTARGETANAVSPRLLALVAPVVAGGLAATGAAAWSVAAAGGSWTHAAGIALLLAAAIVAEAFPVPLESLPAGYVSLAAVFVVGAALVYGWSAAVLVAAVTRVALELVQRRPLVRMAYNGAVYALAGAAAGGAASLAPGGRGVAATLTAVSLSAAAFYAVNVLLVTAVIALWAQQPFAKLIRESAYWTAAPFAIMASVSLMLAVLWRESPAYALALFGPLVATVLYQRSTHSALKAMRLALTDQLTGLGNHRHFIERLQADLDRAQAEGFPLTLVLLDLDDFKSVNDRHGHPAGDRVLEQVAEALRQGGEAFRLGGDEFALLLTHRSREEGAAIARVVVERLSAVDFAHGEPVSFSAGVVAFPQDGVERSELVRLADVALYAAKADGKNRVRVYEPRAPRLRDVAAAR